VSTNPYAPPKAAVADVVPVSATSAPIFFPVSRKKLIVLLIVTFTLYELVWFYKNWALVRRSGEPVWPLVRTILTVFFCYNLFDRVRTRALPLGLRLPADWLAAGWIVCTLAANVLDRFVPAEEFTVLDGVVFFFLFASVSFLVPVQNAINAINRAEVPDHDPNDRFTVWNWLWIVVGGLLLALIALGLLVPAA
jgi:hypothetical protein